MRIQVTREWVYLRNRRLYLNKVEWQLLQETVTAKAVKQIYLRNWDADVPLETKQIIIKIGMRESQNQNCLLMGLITVQGRWIEALNTKGKPPEIKIYLFSLQAVFCIINCRLLRRHFVSIWKLRLQKEGNSFLWKIVHSFSDAIANCNTIAIQFVPNWIWR